MKIRLYYFAFYLLTSLLLFFSVGCELSNDNGSKLKWSYKIPPQRSIHSLNINGENLVLNFIESKSSSLMPNPLDHDERDIIIVDKNTGLQKWRGAVNNAVYHINEDYIYYFPNDYMLSKAEFKKGEVIWSYGKGNFPNYASRNNEYIYFKSAIFNNNEIYLLEYGHRLKTILISLDHLAGTEKWKYDINGNDALVIPYNDKLYIKTIANTIEMINKSNGNVLTDKSNKDIFDDVLIYNVVEDQAVRDAVLKIEADGKITWISKQNGEVNQDTSDIILYKKETSRNGNIYTAIDFASGKEKWKTEQFYGDFFIAKERVVLFDSEKKTIQLFNAITGIKLNEFFLEKEHFGPTGNIDDKMFYFYKNENVLTAIDLQKGSIIWETQIKDYIRGKNLNIKNNLLYILTKSYDSNKLIYSKIYLINKINGAIIKEISIKDEIYEDPVSNDNYIYFNTSNGIIYLYDLKSFEQKLKYISGSRIINNLNTDDKNVYFSHDGTLSALPIP